MNFKFIISIMLFLVLSGCSESTDYSKKRIDIAKENKGDIVIGVAWDFRGDYFEEGVDLALEEINASGGIDGNQLQLIKADDQSSVTHGLSVAQSFANNLDIVAVIGHRKSSISIPTADIYDNAGILMLTPASTSPKLTKLGYKYVFSSIPNDEYFGEQLSQYAKDSGYRNIGIFYKNDDYGRGLANEFEDSSVKNGITIIDRISSYSDFNDLKRIADKWITLDVDAIFMAEDMPGGAEIIADIRKAGINVPIIGGNALDSETLGSVGGIAVEGTVVGSIFNPNDPNEKTTKFVKEFTDRYKVTPTTYAAQGYDAVHLLADAIQAAGSRVPMDVANSLRAMDSWVGVTGSHSFDSNGNVENKEIVKKIFRNNQFDYLDKGGVEHR